MTLKVSEIHKSYKVMNDLTRKYASLCGTDCTGMALSGEQKEDPDAAFLMFTAMGNSKSIFT